MTGPLWVILTLTGFLSLVLGAAGLGTAIVDGLEADPRLSALRPDTRGIVLCCVLIVAGLVLIRFATG